MQGHLYPVILARVIFNRLILSEDNLLKIQCGFRLCRSIIEIISTLKQVQEKYWDQNLYSVFLDLIKTLDIISEEASVFPLHKFLKILWYFHNGKSNQVLSNGNHSNLFSISNGMNKGSIRVLLIL